MPRHDSPDRDVSSPAQTMIFHIELAYNVEEESAEKALDKVISLCPIRPLSIHVDPMETIEEED